jgi:hypothetical protein
MPTYRDFNEVLKNTLDTLVNYEDPKNNFIANETMPYLPALIKLNEYRLLTISSQPNRVWVYESGSIKVERSFLWFHVENNEIGLLLIDKLKNNKNIYIQCHGENDITFSNFPFYKCTQRVYYSNDSNEEYENQEIIGYPHTIYIEPSTYKIIHERVIINDEWYNKDVVRIEIDEVHKGHESYYPAEADYKNCFYIRVCTVNTANGGISAIEEVLNVMNEIISCRRLEES